MNQPSQLILDACSLINLMASGLQLRDVSTAVGSDFLMTEIAADESLYVAGTADGDPSEPINPAALATAGALTLIALTPAELASFVTLAKSIDDGEASTIAAARERGLAVATDDRRAIRVARELEVAVVTTAQLLRIWADRSHASSLDATAAIRNIERRATFRPRRDDPEHAWWNSRATR